MKKLFLVALIFLFQVTVKGQAQRLAMLPYSMKLVDRAGTSYLPTLCVDYFNDVPKAKDAYKVMGNSASLEGMNIQGVDSHFDKVKVKDANGRHVTPRVNQTTYLSPGGNAEALPTSYTDFIESRIQHYNVGGFNKLKQKELQNDVWAYDVMNRLGYVDLSILNPTKRFTSAKLQFKKDILSFNSVVKNEEIIDFAGILKLHLHDNGAGAETSFVWKNPSNQYVLFNDVAPPIYIGTEESELADAINSHNTNEHLIIKTLGFKNDTKAKAFQFEIKDRFDEKFSKDISVVNDDVFNETSYLTKKCDYNIIRDFNNKILRSEDFYHAEMIISVTEKGIDRYAEIKAFSNKSSAINSFFYKIKEKITNYKQRFELLFFLKDLRKSIIKKMGPNTNFYAIITNQLGSKTLVHIEDGKLLTTRLYASE